MDSVITKLQELTKSDSSSIIELIDLFAIKYPKKSITLMALKDFVFNENPQKINEKSILEILAQVQS